MTDTAWSETGSPAPTNESEKPESMHMLVENRATARQSSTPEISHPIQGIQSQPIDANRPETNTGLVKAPNTIIAPPWTISVPIPNILPHLGPTSLMALLTKQRRRRSIKTDTHPPRILIPILKLPQLPLHSPTIHPNEFLSTASPLPVAPAKTSTSNLLGITTRRMAPPRTTMPGTETEMTRAVKSISATFWAYRT
jgi:hypothetical protein